MHKVPLLSGPEVVKLFRRLGWYVARQRGSYISNYRGVFKCTEIKKEKYYLTVDKRETKDLSLLFLRKQESILDRVKEKGERG